jgi:aminopeptidase-like protein
MKTKLFLLFSISLLIFSCAPKKIEINKKILLEGIQILSSDSLEGRGFSKPGNYKAQQFIANKFKELGLKTYKNQKYIEEFPYTFSGRKRQRMFPFKNANEDLSNIPDTTVIGGNVIGKIIGETDKTIVITGHLDHLGIKNGQIYNGADDDASGTAALFAMADYFKKNKQKHTLVFAAVDAEEIGSLGADYFLKNYIPKENIVLNINMDMIAHNDSLRLFASGTHHYPQLKKSLENIESPITLLFGHDDSNNKKEDDWTFSSDHRIFHKEKIPFIYFGVEDHKDYHKPTDTLENINQEFYVDAVKLIIKAIENYDASLK